MIPRYKKILLKLSGEALMGDQGFGISPGMIRFVAEEIRSIVELGVQTAVVVGGGNIIRGVSAHEQGIDRITGDSMVGAGIQPGDMVLVEKGKTPRNGDTPIFPEGLPDDDCFQTPAGHGGG